MRCKFPAAAAAVVLLSSFVCPGQQRRSAEGLADMTRLEVRARLGDYMYMNGWLPKQRETILGISTFSTGAGLIVLGGIVQASSSYYYDTGNAGFVEEFIKNHQYAGRSWPLAMMRLGQVSMLCGAAEYVAGFTGARMFQKHYPDVTFPSATKSRWLYGTGTAMAVAGAAMAVGGAVYWNAKFDRDVQYSLFGGNRGVWKQENELISDPRRNVLVQVGTEKKKAADFIGPWLLVAGTALAHTGLALAVEAKPRVQWARYAEIHLGAVPSSGGWGLSLTW